MSAFGVNLEIKGVPDTVEFGKFITVDIVYEGGKPYGDFDLQQWQGDFFIDYRGKAREAIDDKRVRITQHLRLYPRGTGSLVIERIAFGGTIAGPIRIQSLPPLRKGVDASPQLHSLPNVIWQGQQITLTVDVPLLHPSNRIKAEEVAFEGFKVLGVDKSKLQKNGAEVVRLQWHLVAEQARIQQLAPPAIEQRGRGRWRFYLPFTSVNVRPLPSYLLPGVPVGNFSAQATVEKILGIKWWVVSLESQGDLSTDVYGVRNYMATLAGVGARSVHKTAKPWAGGVASQEYRVKVPDWSLGRKLPLLNLRYFDTEAGRMREFPVSFPSAWNIPKSVFWLIVFLFLAVLGTLGLLSHRLLQKFQSLQHIKQAILNAPNADALRTILLATGPFVSLTAWAESMQSEGAVKQAEQINALSFSISQGDLPVTLKRSVMRWYQPQRVGNLRRWLGARIDFSRNWHRVQPKK